MNVRFAQVLQQGIIEHNTQRWVTVHTFVWSTPRLAFAAPSCPARCPVPRYIRIWTTAGGVSLHMSASTAVHNAAGTADFGRRAGNGAKFAPVGVTGASTRACVKLGNAAGEPGVPRGAAGCSRGKHGTSGSVSPAQRLTTRAHCTCNNAQPGSKAHCPATTFSRPSTTPRQSLPTDPQWC